MIQHHQSYNRGEVYLKLECLQRTGSLKIRGAYYAISKVKDEVKTRGCIAASVGNHAQGVAFAATLAGVSATIVMPQFDPVAKIQATRGYGVEVLLHGKTYDDAVVKALQLCEEQACVFIHSFDDLNVIGGQGTIGIEMLTDVHDLDMVVVPVGGGLIAGVGVAIRNLKPKTKIYGVQASGAPSMVSSFEEKKIVELQEGDTIADGNAIKQTSNTTFNISRELVDDTVTVEDDGICSAIFLLLERCKQVVEPAGVVGLAAFLNGAIDIEGKKVGIVISGDNIDIAILARIIERSLYKDNRIVTISGLLSDRADVLRDILKSVTKAQSNVVRIAQDRNNLQIPPCKAKVTMMLEVSDMLQVNELLKLIQKAGYSFTKDSSS